MQSKWRLSTIEFIILIIGFLLIVLAIFFQIQNIRASESDKQRKSDINAIYYGLEKVYKKEHGNFPENVNSKTLPYVSKEAFNDPDGQHINARQSNYRYNPSGCVEGECQGFSLRTTLQKEADYIKTDLTTP